MTSLVKRVGIPLTIAASVVLLAGCNDSKSSSGPSNSGGGDPKSAIYQKECQAMLPIFSDPNTPAASKDPEKVIAGLKAGPGWGAMTKQQQDDAVAGIRKAGTGSCN
ncbi:hypothetical protein [Nocardia stercoris]|uniref:Lipoprotein n=1 Tax=Nocardia stercoris TaxID=2483361 RepID=A0A3M2KWE5_9NOCA|nr:hypothetical protein [Nocardia stercoris]RMI29334.1 hypothetical protein EBN03_26785 [Nocardia stercoris]